MPRLYIRITPKEVVAASNEVSVPYVLNAHATKLLSLVPSSRCATASHTTKLASGNTDHYLVLDDLMGPNVSMFRPASPRVITSRVNSASKNSLPCTLARCWAAEELRIRCTTLSRVSTPSSSFANHFATPLFKFMRSL